MASSRLVGTRAPLLLPDFNAASSPVDQAPLSPPRAPLSPARSASPSRHGLPARNPTLSPSRLMPGPIHLASPRTLSTALEIVSSSAPDTHLTLPAKAVPKATDDSNLDKHSDAVGDLTSDAISVETVTGAHILGAAVALLASTTEGPAEQEPLESSQSADMPAEDNETRKTAVCLENDSLSQEGTPPLHTKDSGPNSSSDVIPWWLGANKGSGGSGDHSNEEHGSWWTQQVGKAWGKEHGQEALQGSLHRHKGPDAPYALEDADPLLAAATPSLGDPSGGGTWWSQLTKVPTEDWLHLQSEEQAEKKESGTDAAIVGAKSGEQSDSVTIEGHEQAEGPGAVAIDGRGFPTFNSEGNVSADAIVRNEVSTAEVPSARDALVDETQGDIEAEGDGAAVTFADALIEGGLTEQPASPVISVPSAAENGTDASLITSAILVAAEGLILDAAIAPSNPQLDPPAPQQPLIVELSSPVEEDILDALPITVEGSPTITDQLTVDVPSILTSSINALLAPAQPATELVEPTSDGLLEATTESAPTEGVATALPSPKSAVKDAQARLETIKGWRSSRPQMLSLTAPIALAPPSPSGLPSLSLVSGVFPTRGSPRVTDLRTIDRSIWKTLKDMEWATESTADTFGRSSVAAHLAERHDEKHG